MQKINFQNLPNTTSPINDTNLNGMQDNIENGLVHGYKGSQQYYSSIDDFKSALITSTYAVGSYFVDLNINGALKNAIVQKASNSYLSFILFGYSEKIHEYKYTNGSWNDFQYVKESDYDTNNTYSTSEVRTGKVWIDGKPIYRKVVEYTWNSTIGNANDTTNITISHNISNFGNLVSCFANIAGEYNLPVLASGSATLISRVYSTSINFRIIKDTWGANTLRVILEYTKTTD